jgi:anti-sigma factor RsiW
MKCDFDKLVAYLDKKLDLDDQLAVLEHLDFCDACFDAVYQLSRDRDADLFVSEPETILAHWWSSRVS